MDVLDCSTSYGKIVAAAESAAKVKMAEETIMKDGDLGYLSDLQSYMIMELVLALIKANGRNHARQQRQATHQSC